MLITQPVALLDNKQIRKARLNQPVFSCQSSLMLLLLLLSSASLPCLSVSLGPAMLVPELLSPRPGGALPSAHMHTNLHMHACTVVKRFQLSVCSKEKLFQFCSQLEADADM